MTHTLNIQAQLDTQSIQAQIDALNQRSGGAQVGPQMRTLSQDLRRLDSSIRALDRTARQLLQKIHSQGGGGGGGGRGGGNGAPAPLFGTANDWLGPSRVSRAGGMAAVGMMFTAQQCQSKIEEQYGERAPMTSAYRNTSMLQSAGQYAAIGAQAGPLGALAGAITGAAIGFIEATEKAKDAMTEFADKTAEISRKAAAQAREQDIRAGLGSQFSADMTQEQRQKIVDNAIKLAQEKQRTAKAGIASNERANAVDQRIMEKWQARIDKAQAEGKDTLKYEGLMNDAARRIAERQASSAKLREDLYSGFGQEQQLKINEQNRIAAGDTGVMELKSYVNDFKARMRSGGVSEAEAAGQVEEARQNIEQMTDEVEELTEQSSKQLSALEKNELRIRIEALNRRIALERQLEGQAQTVVNQIEKRKTEAAMKELKEIEKAQREAQKKYSAQQKQWREEAALAGRTAEAMKKSAEQLIDAFSSAISGSGKIGGFMSKGEENMASKELQAVDSLLSESRKQTQLQKQLLRKSGDAILG